MGKKLKKKKGEEKHTQKTVEYEQFNTGIGILFFVYQQNVWFGSLWTYTQQP